jgi:uncharacterized protein YdcH (DUF465 family)
MLEQTPAGEPGKAPSADLNKIFDLDRKQLTRKMVDRFEEIFRQQQSAADDLKVLVTECTEADFKPRDIQSMKKHAKLRLKDKTLDAREQLESLDRIGKIIGQDLFDFAGIDG